MNLQKEKLDLIELLISVGDEKLLMEIKAKLLKRREVSLKPMTLEAFYKKIEESEKAIRKGDVISHNDLRKEVETWKKS